MEPWSAGDDDVLLSTSQSEQSPEERENAYHLGLCRPCPRLCVITSFRPQLYHLGPEIRKGTTPSRLAEALIGPLRSIPPPHLAPG